MADLPTDFWAGWIATITILSFLGLGWLIFSAYFAGKTHEEETTSPVWDENLREGSNPAPMWWFWLIFSAMIFTVIYLMLYPGLGSYAGALQWSQGGRLDESISVYEAKFGGVRKLVAEAQLKTLQADPTLMRSAQRVFDRNCAVCHGYDAKGKATYFPDLTDAQWQWGGSAQQIEQSIRAGRTAAMPAWRDTLGEDGVAKVADYVQAMQRGAADGHPGQARFNQFCTACHGADGTGNAAIGAPSLIDRVSLYGDGLDAVKHSIAFGRNGQMPGFSGRLDETQIRLLVALLTREAETQ